MRFNGVTQQQYIVTNPANYPVLPAIYIVTALFIDVVLLRYKPQYTWPGLIIVLLGIPVYFLWSRQLRHETSATL